MTQEIRVPQSKTEKEALEAIYDVLTHGAANVQQSFTDPDDDWESVWLVIDQEGVGSFISGDLPKHELVDAVGDLIRRLGAVAVGSVHSSWAIVNDDIPLPRMMEIMKLHQVEGIPLSDFPESEELLVLALYTAGSAEAHSAQIVRHEGAPPTLEPWVKWPTEGGSVEGRMVDPIQAGLRRLG